MAFTCETEYNTRTLTSMAKALRKTIRKKRSRRFHIFGWMVMVLGLFLSLAAFSAGFVLSFRTVITLLAMAIVFIALLFEDKINGYAARKQLLPGTEKAKAVFGENGFDSTTTIAKSEWQYDKIQLVAETVDYFVFIFSVNHAQIYDKQHLQGGTADDFRHFIEKVTGKQVQFIK